MIAGRIFGGLKSQTMHMTYEGEKFKGNTKMMAFPETFHLLPHITEGRYKVGQVLCENSWPDGSPCVMDPRYVVRTQLNKLQDMGYKLLSGWEKEFFIYNSDRTPIDSDYDFSSNLTLTKYESLLYDICTSLAECGVEIETIHKEFSPGQFEIATSPVEGMKGIDAGFISKQFIKEICQMRGLLAVYMTFPSADSISECGNFLQFNMSVWDSKKNNVFYSQGADYNLSETAGNWIGGIIEHARALTALGYPTVNCYRAMTQPGCSSRASWGLDTRKENVVRLKNPGGSDVYLEFRLSGGASNPYLVAAAVLAAGLDGIAKKTPLPKKLDGNADKLPATLAEALVALEEDKVIGDALGQDFIHMFISLKREFELKVLEGCGPGNDNAQDFEREKTEYFQ